MTSVLRMRFLLAIAFATLPVVSCDDDDSHPSDAGVDAPSMSCQARAASYAAVVANAKSCQTADDCQVLSGQCSLALGGCYELVNNTLKQQTLNDLGTGYQQAGCGGGVCDCAPPPPVACIQNKCANPCPEKTLPNCPRACGAGELPNTACSVGDVCGNEIGDGCTCVAGMWSCTVHAPLGLGCNLVCTRR